MTSLRPLVAAVVLMVIAPAVAQTPADQLALSLESAELHEDLWLAQLFTATNAEALACASLGELTGVGDRALTLISTAARWFLDGAAGVGLDTAAEEAPWLLCAASTRGLAQFQEGLARFYHDTDAARMSDVRYCTLCTLDQQPWSEQDADTVGVPLFLTSFRGTSSIYPARTYHLLFLEAGADVGVAPIVILAWPNKNDIDPF